MPDKTATTAPDWLSADDAAFLQKGLSMAVASRDARHAPSLTRGLGCRFSDDGTRLLVIVERGTGAGLLADVARTGEVAVVVTEPSTHRTLQFKGFDAVVEEADAQDLATVAACREGFGTDILSLGFSAAFRDCLFHHLPEDLRRVTFTPRDIYQQTPGPDAGARVGPGP